MNERVTSESRKLAAILFADIVGYTKMMQKDEREARHALEHFRSILRKSISKFNGRLIKHMGDGCLCLFNSSTDAVHCAIELQELFQHKNVPVRIGIHSGEVFFEAEDVFGDSVNIAARIESMGVPGAILFSKKVEKEIKNHLEFKIAPIGKYKLKNVSEPIEIFGLSNKGIRLPRASEMDGKFKKVNALSKQVFIGLLVVVGMIVIGTILYFGDASKKSNTPGPKAINANDYFVSDINQKSLVVLPFTLITAKSNQEYLSDGMMEEVLNRLYQIRGLKVSSRTSSMKFKDSQKSTREIANELRVAHVLEGSVRQKEQEVQVTMRLIDARTDTLKWMAIFDRSMDEIFSVQSDIAKEVAAILKVSIEKEVEERITEPYTQNIEAWKLFRMARLAADNDDVETAERFLRDAIDLDRDFAPPYAELGFLTLLQGSYLGNAAPAEILETGQNYLNKALALNPDYPRTRIYLAIIHLWFNWDFERSDKEWSEFHRLGPSNPKDAGYIEFLIASKRFKEAVEISNEMLEENPQEMASWSTSGLSFYFDGDKQKAINHYRDALRLFNSQSITIEAARTFLFCERHDLVIETLEKGLEDYNDATSRRLGMLAVSYFKTNRSEEANILLNILKDRTEKTSVGSPSYYLAGLLAQMGKEGEAFQYLDKAYKNKEVEMYWLNIEKPFEPLKGDPRWKTMIEQIGFPNS